jgi:hypothetical protein
MGAGDIARAASAGAAIVQRLFHRRQNLGVLAHSEIVVRAPDGDGALAIRAMAAGMGKIAGTALKIGKDAVAALRPQLVNLLGKESVVIHCNSPRLRAGLACYGRNQRPDAVPKALPHLRALRRRECAGGHRVRTCHCAAAVFK